MQWRDDVIIRQRHRQHRRDQSGREAAQPRRGGDRGKVEEKQRALDEGQQRQLETASSVLSADFAFREAIATQDQPTVRSVISNHGKRIHAQVMMVADTAGALIATTQRDRLKPALPKSLKVVER